MQLLVQKGQRTMERDFLTWHRLMLRMHEPCDTLPMKRWDAPCKIDGFRLLCIRAQQSLLFQGVRYKGFHPRACICQLRGAATHRE